VHDIKVFDSLLVRKDALGDQRDDFDKLRVVVASTLHRGNVGRLSAPNVPITRLVRVAPFVRGEAGSETGFLGC
jgi:hypothetical protein